MRKNIFVILLALVLVLNCGCGREGDNKIAKEEAYASKTTEITEVKPAMVSETKESAEEQARQVIQSVKNKREYEMPERFKQILDEYEEDETFLPRLPILNTVSLCDYSEPIRFSDRITIGLPLTEETKCSDVFSEHSESESFYYTAKLECIKCDWQWINRREDINGMALTRSKDVEYVLDDSFTLKNSQNCVTLKPTYGKGNKANGFGNVMAISFATSRDLGEEMPLKEAFEEGLYYYELKLTDSTFDGLEADGDYFDGNIFQQYLADNFGKPSYIIAEDYNTMVEPDIRSQDHIKWESEYSLFYETEDSRFIVEIEFRDLANTNNYSDVWVTANSNAESLHIWARPLFEDFCEKSAESGNLKVYRFDDWYENPDPEAYTGGNAEEYWNVEG